MIRWRAPRSVCRAWWRRELASEASETWVYLSDGTAVAYIVLVLDPNAYARDKASRLGLAGTAVAVFRAPHLFLWRLYAHLAHLKEPGGGRGGGRKDTTSVNALASKSLWIQPIAVNPTLHGRGVGTALMSFADARASVLGFRSIRLSVELGNTGAIHLYEKCGYSLTRRQYGRGYYAKTLTESVACGHPDRKFSE
jgi:GNAT superfamily N-acetyltransferase